MSFVLSLLHSYPYAFAAAFSGGFLSLLLVAVDPTRLLMWLVCLHYFKGVIVQAVPGLYRFSPYFFSLGLVFIVPSLLLRFQFKVPRAILPAWFLAFLGAFLGIASLSALLNGSLPGDYFISVAMYLRYPLLFILLVGARVPYRDYYRLSKVFVFFSILQILPMMYQFYFSYVKGSLLVGYGDAVYGFMGSNWMVVPYFVIQSWLFALWLNGRLRPVPAFSGIAALWIVMMMAEINVSVLCLPLLIYLLILHRGLQLSRVALIAGVAILAVLVGALIPSIAANLTIWGSLKTAIEPGSINGPSFGRVILIPFSFPFLMVEPWRVIFGFGPESTYLGGLGGEPGKVMSLMSEVGIVWSTVRITSVFRTMMEYGLVGLFLYWACVVAVWLRMRTLLKPYQDVASSSLRLVMDSVGVTYAFLWPLYGNAWRLDVHSFLFWLVCAMCVAKWRESRSMELESEVSAA